jgi:hypothetical protein
MPSLDFSSAFDMVNVKLLVKRLQFVGLPDDVINLLKIWLNERKHYMTINEKFSVFYDLQSGIIQG